MKILFIEPYYTGSHKQWIDSYKKYSAHQIDLLTLPGKNWKWRMHGGAISLSEAYIKKNINCDIIVVSDMLNLPVFIALSKAKIKNTKIITYFHENQMSYPKSLHDKDKELNRDLHYSFINYSTALSGDINLFNSEYHFNIYFHELKKYLKKMPDKKNVQTIDLIKRKSMVLHLGCDLKKFKNKKEDNNNTYPTLLWNHRWEYDKNPELFFNTLYRLKDEGIKFSLIVLGQQFSIYPGIFDEAKKELKDQILHFGYCKSFNEYKNWLYKSDIIPVTSNQDFFGVSAIEAVYCNAYPLLPNRLSYPEIFNKKSNEELFYNNDEEFHSKLSAIILDYKNLRNSIIKYKKLISRFDWDIQKNEYDELFNKIYQNN